MNNLTKYKILLNLNILAGIILPVVFNVFHWGWIDDPAFDLAMNGSFGTFLSNCYLIGDGYHLLLGSLFTSLYEFNNTFGWNAFISNTLLIISLAGILYSEFKPGNWWESFISLGTLWIIYLWLISSYTFISLSIFSTIAGILLLNRFWRTNSNSKSLLVMGILLLITGIQTRLQGSLIAYFSVLLYLCANEKSYLKSQRFFIITLIYIGLGTWAFKEIYFSNNADSNEIKKVDQIVRLANNLGLDCSLNNTSSISALQMRAIKYWYVADEAHMKIFVKDFHCDQPSVSKYLTWVNKKFILLIQDLQGESRFHLFNSIPILPLIVWLFVIVILIHTSHKSGIPVKTFAFFSLLALYLMIGIAFYMPYRLYQPLLIVLYLFVFKTIIDNKNQIIKIISIQLLILISFFIIYETKANYENANKRQLLSKSFAKQIKAHGTKSILWTDSEGICTLHSHPLKPAEIPNPIYMDSYLFLYLRDYKEYWVGQFKLSRYLDQINYLLKSKEVNYLGNLDNYRLKSDYLQSALNKNISLKKVYLKSSVPFYMPYHNQLILGKISFAP